MGCSVKCLELSAVLIMMMVTMMDSTSAQQVQVGFRCSGGGSTTCKGLVGYTTTNATRLSDIKTLFNIKRLRTLLAANNLSASTPSSFSIPANQTVNVPFPCFCDRNGNGMSNHTPMYTVVSGDGLDSIARNHFAGLVTYQQIQLVNNIPDADRINVSQRLWIPLPCSCDDVDGEKVVHYGLVVAPGSSLEVISQQYNASEAALLTLNNLTSPRDLLAGAVLDVPLKTCSSSVANNSLDYPLLVTNGTYVYTANNCVRCRCDASVSWTLQCEPALINSSCPAIPCQQGGGNLFLGNTTTSGCNRTTCAYAGYTNDRTILTTLALESTCPAPAARSSAISLRKSLGWNGLVVLMQMSLFLLLSVPFIL